ncbi:cysteine hydrolase [Bdellovibrio sp. SKB1291214]|uniref:cysteine hydrolase family protein n=1 Tax=Bdellovibrio sp. SKB1291214 TaxID=1732569 RepID=UPI000B519DB8|nr:isochorismatase family cysteine hydrolase [Bdellovibrio sp. SKB1291214]UYL07995.1 cysteine hydrolase [Bdellovibrio sp. SKB1291214]
MQPNKIKAHHGKALLIVDMINSFDFPDGKKLVSYALPAAKKIQALKKKAMEKGVPIIYVNDNFGLWRSNWQQVYDHCAAPESLGREICSLLKPSEKDYFILKPRHSAFYNTNLPTLLDELGTKELIITGAAGNICVLFTVNDAYMQDYKVHVPSDCIASNTSTENNFALKQMKNIMKVKVSSSKYLVF